MKTPSLRPLCVVVACHFLSGFAILGMAPYFATILEKSFAEKDPSWAGIFYGLPLFVMAVAGPLWGAFADRFGKKVSLIRAQLGLTVSLLACGMCHSAWTFGACLVLQGIFGGTFSASNALLAQYYRGPYMAKALSYLQYSARLSLFLAPSVLGVVLLKLPDPLRAYNYLWTLPFISFLVLQGFLPPPPVREAEEIAEKVDGPVAELPGPHLSFNFLMFIELWFTLMTVMTFPYFVKYSLSQGVSDDMAGVYFGTPHVVYLLLAFVVIRRASIAWALELVAMAFLLFTVAMIGHVFPALFFLARVLMGVSLVYGFIYINELVGHGIKQSSAGKAFGWLDTASKFGGVFASLGASLSVHYLGLAGPLYSAGAIGVVFAIVMLLAGRRANFGRATQG